MSDVPSNLIPTRISQLPLKTATTSDSVIGVQNGVTCKLTVSDLIGSVTVPTYRTIATGSCLTGGGDLSADRTISVLPNSIGATQLTLTGVAAGTYGSSTTVPVITVDTSGRITSASSTSVGSVTSVGLSMPTEFTVTNSPVISSGSLTASWSVQTANKVLAAPSTGSGTPSFRLLVASDIPSLSATYVLKAGDTMTGGLTLPASTSSLIPLYMPPGTTPSSPVNGNLWHDGNGMYLKNRDAIHQLDADANAVGALSNATISLGATTGCINVSSVDVFIYAASGWQGDYMRRTVAAVTNIGPLTDGSQNYLVVDYNSGTPVYAITTSASSVNNSNRLLIATMWRDGADIHWAVVNWGLATATRLNDRLINIQRYVRSSGLVLGETTGNTITSTSGLIWYGIKAFFQTEQSSAVSNAIFYYHSGGSWTSSRVSTYNTAQYDNGTNLVGLTPSKFTVNWVYQFVNGDGLPKLAYYLGNASYSTVAAAAGASQPTPPLILSQMAVLLGRIIVGTGATTASQIDSAFTTVFAGTAITDHNSLAGLQGGASSQYYHLTSTEYTGTGTGAFVRADGATLTGLVTVQGLTVGRGGGASQTNVAFGTYALYINSTGTRNTAIGAEALFNNLSSSDNTAIGFNALYSNSVGGNNVAVGGNAFLQLNSGSYNVAIGGKAAIYQADGSTLLTSATNSVYIGANTRGYSNSDSNSIVIGCDAVGEGANTTVIGNSSTTSTHLYGKVGIGAAPTGSSLLYVTSPGTPSIVVEGTGGASAFTPIFTFVRSSPTARSTSTDGGFIFQGMDTASVSYQSSVKAIGNNNTPATQYLVYDGKSGHQFRINSVSSPVAIIYSSGVGIGTGTTAPTSMLQVVGLPVYANNASAITGGLTAGAFYRTGADPDHVCVVH